MEVAEPVLIDRHKEVAGYERGPAIFLLTSRPAGQAEWILH